MSVNAGEADIHVLAELTFQDEHGAGCKYGLTSLRYPIGLKTYDIAALRMVYDDIDQTFRQHPQLAGSFFLLENYSTQAVQAIDEDSTAFPHRSDKILVTSYIQYQPDADVELVAHEYGLRLRKHLLDKSDDPTRLRAYVNYAHGTESLEEVYGWDESRLARLRKLKAKWDPKNRMRYYMPIS